jgi:hypothetical protein
LWRSSAGDASSIAKQAALVRDFPQHRSKRQKKLDRNSRVERIAEILRNVIDLDLPNAGSFAKDEINDALVQALCLRFTRRGSVSE